MVLFLITTKKGKGRISINYSGRVSYAQPTRIIDMVSNYADYMEWINESGENIGQKGNFDQTTIDLWREKAKDPNGVNENGVPNYVAYPNTDWQKEIFKHGLINDHNLSLSGGTDKTRFLASLGYMDNPGLVDRTGVKQYKMRVNLEADVTKWLTAGARIYGDMKDQEVGNFSNANNYLRQTTPGVYPEWNGQYGYPEAPEESATANNLLQKLNDTNGSTKKTNVNAAVFSKITFMKGLTWTFNFNYKRYNYRANLDFDATKTTLISVNIGGRIETKRTPESGEDQNQLFRKLYWAVPFAGAGIVDGKRVVSNADYLPFTGSDGLNSYYGKGFRSTTTNVLNVDLVLDQKLDFITKGLSFKLKGSYNTSYWTQKIASSSMAVYTPVLHDDGSIGYRKSGSDSQLSYSRNSNGEGKSRDWYMEAALNYSRKFGDHNVTGLVLYNQSKRYYPGGTYDDIPSAYVGFVGRATYDYKTRYMAEFNVGYNGSENFAPGKRYGLFPAGSIGWIVSEESFLSR